MKCHAHVREARIVLNLFAAVDGIALALPSLARSSTMVEFTNEQRQMLIDKLPDAANVAAGALLFGQFLSERPYSIPLAGAGLAIWLTLVGLSFLLGGKEGA
jgi:hypothetical protein